MPALSLYFLETCPYCGKVLQYMDEHKIKLNMKNVSQNPALREELTERGGKSQVPALQIDDRIMYESDDIVQWLKENYTHDA